MESIKEKTNQEIPETPEKIDQQNTKEILDETQTNSEDFFKLSDTYNSLKIDNLKKQFQDLNELNRISNEKISKLTKQLEPERQDWPELAKKK